MPDSADPKAKEQSTIALALAGQAVPLDDVTPAVIAAIADAVTTADPLPTACPSLVKMAEGMGPTAQHVVDYVSEGTGIQHQAPPPDVPDIQSIPDRRERLRTLAQHMHTVWTDAGHDAFDDYVHSGNFTEDLLAELDLPDGKVVERLVKAAEDERTKLHACPGGNTYKAGFDRGFHLGRAQAFDAAVDDLRTLAARPSPEGAA